MKQNLPSAKSEAPLIALVMIAVASCALAMLASACATLPRPTPSAVQLTPDASRTEPGSVININTASLQELEKLPGVGKAIAERIVAQREQYGPFRRAEHLMMVRGISDRKFRELRALIVTE